MLPDPSVLPPGILPSLAPSPPSFRGLHLPTSGFARLLIEAMLLDIPKDARTLHFTAELPQRAIKLFVFPQRVLQRPSS